MEMGICKKLFCLAWLVLLLCLFSNASAIINWDDGGADHNWNTPANWSGDTLPDGASEATGFVVINGDIVNGPIVDSFAAQAYCLYISRFNTMPATLTMTGGDLTITKWVTIGKASADTGTLDITGGTMTCGSSFDVGADGAGYLNMTGAGHEGGVIKGITTLSIPSGSGTGDVQLDAGTVEAATLSMKSTGSIDITGGTLVLDGNQTYIVDGYLDKGWIITYGQNRVRVAVDYNLNTDKTTVTALEPNFGCAWNPSPDFSSDINADLIWSPGDYAADVNGHYVYFGTNKAAVTDANTSNHLGVYKGPDGVNGPNDGRYSYDLGTLEFGETYYWRIDEANEFHPNSPWKGEVWSFAVTEGLAGEYWTAGGNIIRDGYAWEFRGTNIMSIFGGNHDEVANWGMDIVRECIDMKMTSDADLIRIVNSARSKDIVVILTAFWWDNDACGGAVPYPDCQLLGWYPHQHPHFDEIQQRWREIANLFKGRSDVWFGVWNEPYHWDKEGTASSSEWLYDNELLVDNIRSTSANNIIVVCGHAMGQGHEPFLEKGSELLSGRENIVFDIHTYKTYWDISVGDMRSRFNQIRNVGPLIVGEYGSNGEHSNWPNVINACRRSKIASLPWLWGQYDWNGLDFPNAIWAYSRKLRNQSTDAFSGDFNFDCVLDFYDLAILLSHWLENEPSVDIAPAGGDDFVNLLDLAALSAHWFEAEENEVPTNILLSGSIVGEGREISTLVGTFSTVDPDGCDGCSTHIYSLVSGDGDTDNGSFCIDEASLKTAEVFDYDTKSSYSIRVRTTDGCGKTFEKVFTIAIAREVAIVNQGFELPVLDAPPWNNTIHPVGWDVTGSGVGMSINGQKGQCVFSLDVGTISQSLSPATAGKSYTLSYYSADFWNGWSRLTAKLLIGEVVVASREIYDWNSEWTLYTLQYTADSGDEGKTIAIEFGWSAPNNRAIDEITLYEH